MDGQENQADLMDSDCGKVGQDQHLPLRDRNDDNNCKSDNAVIHIASSHWQFWWKDKKNRRQNCVQHTDLRMSVIIVTSTAVTYSIASPP